MADDMTPVEVTEAAPQTEAAPEPPLAPPPAAPPVTSAPAPAPRRHLGPVWWGIALIAIGGVLLVQQFLPEVELWRYWPLIIVAVGIRGMFGSSTGHWSVKVAAEGLTVVAIGLVFLGQMLGYLGWNVWFNIFKLWPVLLVALGIEIIGKGMHAEWLRVLSSLIVIAGLAYGALVMTSNAGWPPVFVVGGAESTPFSESAPRKTGVSEGSAVISAGVGEFSMTSGNVLASAEGRSPLDLTFDATADGNAADVEIALEGSTFGPARDAELNVTLDSEIAWDLKLSTDVSSFDADLSDIAISALRFEAGVSSGTLTLGKADAAGTDEAIDALVEGGVSSLTVRVPKGDDVRVDVDAGLSAVDFSGDWSETDSDGQHRFESSGFNDAGAYWDIEIDGGIGSINVEYY